MRVTVFGPTGGIGRLVVSELLERGHDVTAYARSLAKLEATDPRVEVVHGEIGDGPAVTAAVKGRDAVISALGPALRRRPDGMPVAEGTRCIVEAMVATGVRRYVGLATPSVRDARDRPTLGGRLIPAMARLMFPDALQEVRVMSHAVMRADLDWTIARITSPTNGPPRGTVRAGFLGRDPVGWRMRRADIARFLVDQLDSPTYQRAAPAISN